jgi:hypothetical protein
VRIVAVDRGVSEAVITTQVVAYLGTNLYIATITSIVACTIFARGGRVVESGGAKVGSERKGADARVFPNKRRGAGTEFMKDEPSTNVTLHRTPMPT